MANKFLNDFDFVVDIKPTANTNVSTTQVITPVIADISSKQIEADICDYFEKYFKKDCAAISNIPDIPRKC